MIVKSKNQQNGSLKKVINATFFANKVTFRDFVYVKTLSRVIPLV